MCSWVCFVLGVLGVLLGWFIALVALFIEFAGWLLVLALVYYGRVVVGGIGDAVG